jgi:2-iminobutanoate/2-iminopropanoate deaminase
MKKTVSAKDLPAALGPYSHAVWAGDFLYCSGQLGIDPATGVMAGDVTSQTERAMENIKILLSSQGLELTDVVKSLVFLADMGSFKAFNEVYGKYFPSEPPARSCVGVAALPAGALVEIEVVAHKQ